MNHENLQSPSHEDEVRVHQVDLEASKKPRKCCIRYGRTWILYGPPGKYGYFPRTCHVGPNWPCMLLTYTVALGPIALLAVKGQLHTVFQICLIISIVATTFAFSMVACSNPGIIFESYIAPPGTEPGVICAQCQIRRPLGASHCYDCRVCIDELDHHCPWTGKCIGKKTLYWFYIFISSVTVHIILVVITVVYHFFIR